MYQDSDPVAFTALLDVNHHVPRPDGKPHNIEENFAGRRMEKNELLAVGPTNPKGIEEI